jgi:hypothetical protein
MLPRKIETHAMRKTVCGFDRNHFSKPVLLAYARGYLDYRDLIAVHQIEDSIIAIETNGLKSLKFVQRAISQTYGKQLPDSYRQLMQYKFNIWVDLLSREKHVAGAILDLVIDGDSFVSVDRRFKRANGWARTNLINGLHFWDINYI